MGLQNQRRTARLAFQSRDYVGSTFENRLELERNGILVEELAHVVGECSFTGAVRILRINAVDGDKVCQRGKERFRIQSGFQLHLLPAPQRDYRTFGGSTIRAKQSTAF